MGLQQDDLITGCSKCGAGGKLLISESESGRVANKDFPYFSPPPLDCPECLGTGQILTEAGKAIVSAMKLAKKQNLL